MPEILFPCDDKAVLLSNRFPLTKNWLHAGPCGFNAELALNKHLQVQKAREAGFNVPQTRIARDANEVRAFASTLPFPIILKAADCVPTWQGRYYSCRKWICDNAPELEKALAEWRERSPLLVQPFITGIGAGLFGLAAPDGVRAWSAHRRLRMMNPQGSGSSACISQSVPEDLQTRAEALLREVRWRGSFMIELLRDHQDKLWFVELNGRPWGSISLSRRMGLEYPSWQVDLALDPGSKVGTGVSGLPGVICRNVGREFMHLLFVLKGPRSKALDGWPSFWTTLGEMARIRRGDTFYNWRRGDARVFFADCCYTVKDNIFKSKN
ncbi:MAG TPA: hypothetical protein VMB19_09185 [Silvibacterium sp.]|nr:hypothetical protein [Silvibacterium sp.]